MADCADCSPCGTGRNNLPLPGDPDLATVVLSARGTFSGIMVSWTWPASNSGAVAYTKIYRSTSSDFDSAVVLVPAAAGSMYFDQADVEEHTLYYYWIRLYSVNSTEGPVIGPAAATMSPLVADLIDQLEQQISESFLAQSLRERIDLIVDVSSSLSDEIQTRLFGEAIFSELLAGLGDNLQAVDTLLAEEVVQRVTGDNALVASINLSLAQSNDNAAAILEEQIVRANADSALAANITTLQAVANGHTASIQTLQIVTAGVNGLYAQWMVKTDVNGYVSGIGLYNTGATSDFIAHVDRFAIGSPSAPNRYPFIVTGGIAYLRNVMIQDAAIDSAKIASAAVGTLKLAGNAVTVPLTALASYSDSDEVDTSSQRVVHINADFGADSSAWPTAVIVMGVVQFLYKSGSGARTPQIFVTANTGTNSTSTANSASGIGADVNLDGGIGRSPLTTIAQYGAPTNRFMTYAVHAFAESPSGSMVLRYGIANLVVLGAKR